MFNLSHLRIMYLLLLVHIPQITKNYMAYHKNHMFVEGSTEKRSL